MTRPPQSYGSFCPVAQASEVLAQRWVPLIVREIMVGYHRFNEIRRALPLISPSVLAQRLKSLEDAGVVARRADAAGTTTYHLTAAGEELRPIVTAMGHWAEKWITRDYRPDELNPLVFMWALRRHVRPGEFPPGRTVLHIVLDGEPVKQRYWWLVVRPGDEQEVDICRADPGYPVSLTITSTMRTLVTVLVPETGLGAAVRRGLVSVAGDRDLVRRVESLFDFAPSPEALAI